MHTILSKIASAIAAPIFLLASLFNPSVVDSPAYPIQEIVIDESYQYPIEEISVGATLPQTTGVFETSLASPITSTATTMTLTSNAIRGGGSISGYTCFTVDEGTAQAEVICGTVSSTSVTAMTRGISYADGVTSVTANQFAHRRGANIKITDFPILQILKAQNNGDATFPNALSYDTGVGPVDSDDLADKEYVLSVVSGGSVTFEKVIVSGTAGETIASGNLVYLKSSDSRWWKTDADTASTVENVILGIAQGSGTAGVAITGGVLTSGTATGLSGLTANTVYYASNTAGGLSSTVGTKEVTVGTALSTTSLAFAPRYNQQITEDEQDAIAGGSTFGTPSSTNKFITQDYNSSATGLPVVRTYSTVSSEIGGSTTQFDITNPAGTTFRYTYDTTGTDPTISCTPNPIGSLVNLQAQNFTAANNGIFTITGCGSNYFEVTNASGVAEVNKTIGTGYILESGTTTWSKPSGLKYIIVELVGGGGSGGGLSADADGGQGGGGAGGYSKKVIQASTLSSTEYFLIGAGGTGNGTSTGVSGRTTNFGNKLYATGGGGVSSNNGGTGGSGFLGDVNYVGGGGGGGSAGTSRFTSGHGGSSFLGGGGAGLADINSDGVNATGYGGGGGGAFRNGSGGAFDGGDGYQGVIILTEYYS